MNNDGRLRGGSWAGRRDRERESESVSGFGKPTFLGLFVRALL